MAGSIILGDDRHGMTGMLFPSGPERATFALHLSVSVYQQLYLGKPVYQGDIDEEMARDLVGLSQTIGGIFGADGFLYTTEPDFLTPVPTELLTAFMLGEDLALMDEKTIMFGGIRDSLVPTPAAAKFWKKENLTRRYRRDTSWSTSFCHTSFPLAGRAMQVISSVVQEHVEEAMTQRALRARLVRAAHIQLHQLRYWDDRLAANLDGIALSDEHGWGLCRATLQAPPSGRYLRRACARSNALRRGSSRYWRSVRLCRMVFGPCCRRSPGWSRRSFEASSSDS